MRSELASASRARARHTGVDEAGTRPGRPVPSDVLLALLPVCIVPAVLATALSSLGPRPWEAVLQLPRQASETGLEAAVVAGLAGVAVIACLWWASALVLAVLGAYLRRLRLPRLASVDRLAPAHLRRVAAVVVCFNLATAPAAFGATGAGSPGIQSVVSGPESGASAPSPAWTPPTASAQTPATTPATHGAPDPSWLPARPAPALERVLGSTRPAADEVVVRTGDTLWSIAARHLGPEASDLDVAEEWPRWYRANLETIGPDPNRLHPGTALRPPTAQVP